MTTRRTTNKPWLLCGLCLSMLGMPGCSPLEGACQQESEDKDCPDGSRCVTKDNFGVCVWGKTSAENPNLTVPDIRLQLTNGTLNTAHTTNSDSLEVQILVYGAPQGVNVELEKAGGERLSADAEGPSSLCPEVSFNTSKERRDLLCLLDNSVEGPYRLP